MLSAVNKRVYYPFLGGCLAVVFSSKNGLHFPIQNFPKIFPSISSVAISPVMLPKW
jgi:hypothetical protein